jgi:hypothetical protein
MRRRRPRRVHLPALHAQGGLAPSSKTKATSDVRRRHRRARPQDRRRHHEVCRWRPRHHGPHPRPRLPGRRLYFGYTEIPRVLNGLGIAIISTSKGLMKDQDCRRNKARRRTRLQRLVRSTTTMSRIGKQPVSSPTRSRSPSRAPPSVEGPKGKVSKTFAPVVKITVGQQRHSSRPRMKPAFPRPCMARPARSSPAWSRASASATQGARDPRRRLQGQPQGQAARSRARLLASDPPRHPGGHQGHRHRPDQAQDRGRRQAARRRRSPPRSALLPAGALQGQGRPHRRRRRARPPQGRQDRRLTGSITHETHELQSQAPPEAQMAHPQEGDRHRRSSAPQRQVLRRSTSMRRRQRRRRHDARLPLEPRRRTAQGQKLKANLAGAKSLGVAFAAKAKAAGIARSCSTAMAPLPRQSQKSSPKPPAKVASNSKNQHEH